MPFLRKSCLCLLGAALATSVLTTGCQSSQPAQDETVIYKKWEVETHRAHKEMNQRPAAEQKEYQDWSQQHRDTH
jgi:hypothetical protein